MGSLTTCLKAAGNLLSAEHRTAIMERARELRADGLKPADAAQRAVDEMIADVQDKLIAAGDERTSAADMQPTGVAEAIVDEFPGIDRRAVAQAVEAGMTEVEIRDAIDEDMADGDVAAATQSLFQATPPASVQDDFGNEVKAEHRPMFSRGQAAAAWTHREKNSQGPEFYSEDLDLIAFTQLDASADLAEHGMDLGHAAQVRDGHTAHKFLILNKQGETLGQAVLEVDADGNVEAIHDIEVFDKGTGTGRRVVESIIASAPGPVRIIDILPQSEGFWTRMGAGYKDQYGNATTDRESLQSQNVLGEDARGTSRGNPQASRGLEAQRSAARGPTESLASRQAAVKAVIDRWANSPDVVWFSSLQDPNVPQAIREEDAKQRAAGAAGVPKGFFFGGRVYISAEQVRTTADAMRVLFHEALGHGGLRGVFGDALTSILDVVAVGRSLDMQRKAKEYGLDLKDVDERRRVAEEVLAEMAQTKPNASLVQRAIAAIRQFLRKIGLTLSLSDNDIISNYILPARRFIQGGGKMENGSESAAPAFARKPSLQSLLRKFGRMPSDRMDVVRSWNDGDRLFYSHDMEESKPTEAKTLDDLEGYAPDQILILPKGAGSTDVPMFSRSADILTSVRDAKLPAGYMVNDFIKSSGKVSWWDKTVGTMHNLAQRNPLFKPVYDAANTFLNDVSFFAASSADLAPTLLPKLEKLRDIGKAPLSAEDTRAISAPIFEGTLEWTRDKDGTPVKEDDAAKAGIVWTAAELREKFGLNDKQIGLYQEFRRATNQSLTNLVLSDVVRFGGKDLEPVRDAVVAAKTIGEASNIVQEHLATLIEQADPKRAAVLSDTGTRITEKLEQAHKMIQRGYAPLMRFGTYTLDATDADGKRIYFGLFESQADANRFARQLAAEYKGANISQGTLSEQAYQMFAGVSPETLELFGGMLGLEAQGNDASSIAFQEYLKLAKSNRSAMKRLIKRKGTEGFSEDAGRVLAGFVYSNARQTSKNLHLGGMTSAVQKIADVKGQGELLDVAVKLQQYVSNPQEEAQAIRGLMFANFLGGSLAAGIVNLSQTVMVTAPYLTQFTSAGAAAKTMAGALKDAARWEMSKNPTTGDAKLDAAIRRAEEEGVISPQEVHGLIAQAGGKAALKAGDGTMAGDALAEASNGLSKFMLLWGRPFAVAEQFNRRTTFIAAYRVAVDKGMSNPAAFAEKAINDTQFVYCVDHETECLTNRGWMRRDDLRVGDAVIGVDSKGAAVPTKLLGLHIFKGPQRAIRFSNNTRFSMVLTPGHDALVQSYNSRDQKWQDLRKVKAGELKRSHHLLRTPTAPVQRPDSVGADMAALLGWIAAEGNYAKFRNCVHRTNVRITQSIKHNPEYVEEIESILRRLGGHYRKFIVKKGEMAIFTLRKPLSDSVRESMPEKILTWRMAETMSQTEMGSLVDAFARGDGTLADEGGWVIAQKDTRNLDVLQAMAIMCGRSATFYPATDSDGGKVAHLYLHKNTLRSHVKALDQESVEIDGAWCPETESGTWIARRNGAVFVTGNSKANRPQWARGAIRGTLFTFKTYAISYVELLGRMAGSGPDGRKAALIGLATMAMISGIDGLPGAGDLDDLIDGLLQRLGYNFSSKRKRHEFLAGIIGEGGAKFMEKGLSGLPGAPIDVSGRLGLGNLIPGTGLLLKKTDHTRDVAEIMGPAGGLAANWFAGANAAVQGDIGQAIQSVAPVAMANVFKAYDMASTGMYRDTRGRKVLDVDGFDAMAKGIGFQPNDVARVQAAAGQVQAMVGLVKMREGEIADKWARGVFEREPDAVRSARAELARWNAANPDAPIKINSTQIVKRVREMGTGRDERLAKTAPREIRATVRRELEAAR